jgi:hypothetical protein
LDGWREEVGGMGRIRCEEPLAHYLVVQGDSARIGPVIEVQDYDMVIKNEYQWNMACFLT